METSDTSAGREPCAVCAPGSPCPKHCGAALRQTPGGLCKRAKGQGTDHVGIGRCDRHGGSTPNHEKAANGQKAAAAVVTFGLPREIDPQTALLEEVHRTAGHVAYLGDVVAKLEQDELKQLDPSERFEQPAVWVRMYQDERKHLTRVAAAAIGAGIAERQVRLAEEQGRQLANVLRDVLGDVFGLLAEAGLSVDVLVQIQREAVPGVVRRRLSEVMEVSSG